MPTPELQMFRETLEELLFAAYRAGFDLAMRDVSEHDQRTDPFPEGQLRPTFKAWQDAITR